MVTDVLTGDATNVAAATERLLVKDITPRLDPKVFVSSNAFRRQYLYTEEVNGVLRTHEGSLKHIFAGLAGRRTPLTGPLRKFASQLIGLAEWDAFMRAVGLVGPDVTERDLMLGFAWSRMCVIDGRTERGRLKETLCPFEGFLEALCRIASLKALPTGEEIRDAGCRDAARFFAMLRAHDEKKYLALLKERATRWGSTPSQPLHRCVAHLIALILRAISMPKEHASELTVDTPTRVSASEVARWVQNFL